LEAATSKDVRAVLRLIEEAGWAYTRSEIHRLIAVQPKGLLVLRSAGLRHGMVGCVYASAWGKVGFIGLMLVRENLRGKGLGSEMMMAAMALLRDEGVTAFALDAVPNAIGFYHKLGFTSSWESQRLSIDTSKGEIPEAAVEVRHADGADLRRAIELDRAFSGMDRSQVLARLHSDKDSSMLVVPGEKEVLAYGVLRRSKGCLRLGPVVAVPRVEDAVAVRSILSVAMAETYPRILTINVPAYNREATEMLVSIGATQYAPCLRMYMGDPGPAEMPEGVWGLGAAEKG
jgi:GNAT superfamily N-acetyltransferase